MYIIYIIIIMKIIIVKFFIFLKKNLKIFELIFENIILIWFNKFLIFIIEILFYKIFENLINFRLLNLKLKMRSQIILKSNKIWKFI